MGGPAGLSGPLASTFKLYVQDVHQMLTESLAASGVEFNEDGEEVALQSRKLTKVSIGMR